MNGQRAKWLIDGSMDNWIDAIGGCQMRVVSGSGYGNV